eukprot:124492_1
MSTENRGKTMQADEALHRYYKLHNTCYLDENGIGKLKLWTDDNGYDSDLIEEDLNTDATESMLVNIDDNFPPNNLGPDAMLEILRKCWTDTNAYLPRNDDEKDEKPADNTPVTALNFTSKYKSELIINGFIVEKKKNNILIPQSLFELIYSYYYLKYNMYKFSKSPIMVCKSAYVSEDACNYELSENDMKFTKITANPYWVVPHVMGIKAGIHVFRYFLYFPTHISGEGYPGHNFSDMVVGIQRFDPGFKGNVLYYDGAVIGWKSWGPYHVTKRDFHKNRLVKKNDTNNHINEELKYCYNHNSKIITFDLKLNCFENLLSHIAVSEDEKSVECEESVLHVPTSSTEKYGWVPHVTISIPSQVVMICEINPDFYGIADVEIDKPIFQAITKDPKYYLPKGVKH